MAEPTEDAFSEAEKPKKTAFDEEGAATALVGAFDTHGRAYSALEVGIEAYAGSEDPEFIHLRAVEQCIELVSDSYAALIQTAIQTIDEEGDNEQLEASGRLAMVIHNFVAEHVSELVAMMNEVLDCEESCLDEPDLSQMKTMLTGMMTSEHVAVDSIEAMQSVMKDLLETLKLVFIKHVHAAQVGLDPHDDEVTISVEDNTSTVKEGTPRRYMAAIAVIAATGFAAGAFATIRANVQGRNNG